MSRFEYIFVAINFIFDVFQKLALNFDQRYVEEKMVLHKRSCSESFKKTS